MDKILEGLVSSSHPLPLKRVIVRKVVESAEHWLDEAQCEAMFGLTTRLILEGQDHFQRQVGHQVLEAYARYHRPEFESFFNKTFVLGLLQQGYHSLDRKDVAILDYIHNGLRLIMSCPSVLDLFSLLQVEVLRMVCERPEPQLCARLSDLLTDFVQCIPKGKLAITFCQQLVRTIGHFQCASTQEKELREYVSQVTKVSNLLQNIWKAEPSTLLPSLQEVFASISSTGKGLHESRRLWEIQYLALLYTYRVGFLPKNPSQSTVLFRLSLCNKSRQPFYLKGWEHLGLRPLAPNKLLNYPASAQVLECFEDDSSYVNLLFISD
jgi:ubiquitin carboxyl-terminal hydrolase 35/38